MLLRGLSAVAQSFSFKAKLTIMIWFPIIHVPWPVVKPPYQVYSIVIIPFSILKIDLAISDFNVLPYLLDTIRLFGKITGWIVTKTERYRIAQAILDNKIQNELEFYFREVPFEAWVFRR